MKTRAAIFTNSILTIILVTVFSFGLRAQNSDTDITKQDRPTGEFKGVKVSNGIQVYLTQGENTSVSVETYSDKQEVVKTEVKDGILKIYIHGRYNKKNSPKVYVSSPKFESIIGENASSVKCEASINSEKMYIDFSSAAELEGTFIGREINGDFSSAASAKLTVTASELYVEISSGASADIIGTTDKFLLDAGSGAEINAFDLASKKCTTTVSSGAEVNIQVEEELIGNASSGSQITYKGNATSDLCSTSSGAEISHKK